MSCVPFQRERDDFRLQINYRKFARKRDHCKTGLNRYTLIIIFQKKEPISCVLLLVGKL